MFIRFLLSDDGQSLNIIHMNENHSNHIISEEVFMHHPDQRRLDPAQMKHAETLMSVQANSKLVQHHLQSTSGKVVLLKDVANIANKLKKHTMPNNLTEVLKQLQRYGDCVVKVLADDEKMSSVVFFYQDKYMQCSNCRGVWGVEPPTSSC